MKMRGDKRLLGGTGESTPFTEQSKEKGVGQWSQHLGMHKVLLIPTFLLNKLLIKPKLKYSSY